MKNIYLNTLFVTVIAITLFGCKEDEPPFVCAQNTVFQFAGASQKWCGRSELRGYGNSNEEESGSIFIRYPAGNVTLIFFVDGALQTGMTLSYGNGIGLSGDIGSVNSATMTITKIDRELELISFYFDFDYHAQSNLTHWDVTGTVADLALKVE